MECDLLKLKMRRPTLARKWDEVQDDVGLQSRGSCTAAVVNILQFVASRQWVAWARMRS